MVNAAEATMSELRTARRDSPADDPTDDRPSIEAEERERQHHLQDRARRDEVVVLG